MTKSVSLLSLITLLIASASFAEESSMIPSQPADTVELIQTHSKIVAGQRREAASQTEQMEEEEQDEVLRQEGDTCETAFNNDRTGASYSPFKAMSIKKD